jgi:hypothetical protein
MCRASGVVLMQALRAALSALSSNICSCITGFLMLIKPVFEVKGEFVSFIITLACCSDVRYYFLEQGVRLSAPVTDSASNRKEVVAVEGQQTQVHRNMARACES